MPIYGTVGGVSSLFPPISSVTAITSAVISKYMDQVEAEINARITKRYDIPLINSLVAGGASVPLLTAITERETVYRIAVSRGLVQFPAAQQGTNPLAVQHKDDQSLIDKIVEGNIELVDNTGNEIAVDKTHIVHFSNTMNYQPTFSPVLDPIDNIVDETHIDDSLANRNEL